MYTSFFGLQETPFSIAPNPRYLYMSKQHRDAFAHLLYGVQGNGGFVLLTGEVGAGKTTLCRCLLDQLPEDTDVAFIFNPAVTCLELCAAICEELSIPLPDHGEQNLKVMQTRIYRHLLRTHSRGRNTLLIVDEAQNLPISVLEQLRLLTNLETNEHKLLQIILLGQPELREMISKPELRQLAQRITARFHLGPLRLHEVQPYIQHRLAIAGVERPLFDQRMCQKIFQRSKGIPRLINVICDRTLLGAYALEQETITAPVLNQAIDEVMGKPLRPNLKPLAYLAAAASVATVASVMHFAVIPGGLTQTQPWLSAHYDDISQRFAAQAVADVQRADHAASDRRKHTDSATIKTHSTATDQTPEITTVSPSTSDIQQTARQQTGIQQRPQPAALQRVSATASNTQDSPTTSTEPRPAVVATVVAPVVATPATPARAIKAVATVGNEQLPLAKPAMRETPPIKANTETIFPVVSVPRSSAAAPISLQTTPETPPPVTLSAYDVLFQLWQIPPSAQTADPCLYALKQGLRCLHGRGSLNYLTKLNRPALLRLRTDSGKLEEVVITTFKNGIATLTRNGRVWDESVQELSKRWSSNYTVLWKPPPGYHNMMSLGETSRSVSWLKEQLITLTSAPMNSGNQYFNNELQRWLKAFQKSQGLKQDGVAGPRTLIHLNSATSDQVPLLNNYQG